MYRLNGEMSTLSDEHLYDRLVSALQTRRADEIPGIGGKARYKISKVLKPSGVSFTRVSTSTAWQISKEDWLAVLAFVKKAGQSGFDTGSLKRANLVFKKQSPTIAFLLASGLASRACLPG